MYIHLKLSFKMNKIVMEYLGFYTYLLKIEIEMR